MGMSMVVLGEVRVASCVNEVVMEVVKITLMMMVVTVYRAAV